MGRQVEEVADAIVAGVSVGDAAREAGVTRRTVHRWLAAGRRSDAEPSLRRLASRVDAAHRRRDLGDGPIRSLAELHQVIDRSARAGSLEAARLVFRRLCREGGA